MSTKFFSDGEVHSYFNPYNTPYEAFINYMNVLSDFIIRIDDALVTSGKNVKANPATEPVDVAAPKKRPSGRAAAKGSATAKTKKSAEKKTIKQVKKK